MHVVFSLLLAVAVYVICRLILKLGHNYVKWKAWKKAVSHLPGEKPSLLWGYTKELSKHLETRLDYLMSLYPKDGSLTAVLPGAIFLPEGVLITQDPALVEHVLHTKHNVWLKNLPDLPPKHIFYELMGDGIFAINHGPHSNDDGNGWRIQRKIAAGIFTQQNFRDYFAQTFVVTANTFKQNLEERLGTSKEVKVNMQDLFFRYTMDSFGLIGFGTDFGTLSGKSNAFATAFDAAHACILPFDQRELPFMMLANLLPWPFGKWGVHMCTYLPLWRRAQVQQKIMNEYIYPLINERRKDPELMEKNDLLSLFIRATMEEKKNISDQFLRDIILNMIIAGRDTTACTLSWLLHCLTTNTEVMAKLVQEIDETLQGQPPTYESIKPMKYLHGCVYETLRLHPPVPIDPKITAVDDELPDGTKVPAKTWVWYLPWVMGRNPNLWENPMVFDPDRWLTAKPSAYEFPVFQAGPRICLGKDMAVLEAKFAITCLLQSFSFSAAVPASTVSYSQMITMGIKDELPVYVSRR
eukprot:TRINITY_DN67909_c5_g3_i6.p1 TRINITY_DN67909_c5_g3~~TRINITY_DN67909_c5_g3_i6.p1  ORF type:complete len:537 (-),score=24.93 TRINITY_DN67909_c5_g3_i6:262-1833(-)